MLTQEQIEKLDPLAKHPRYGAILQGAMKNWTLPDVTPIKGEWGVKWLNDRYVFINPYNQEYCLIGSYIQDKETLDKSEQLCCEIAAQYSGLKYWELSAIVDGFDQTISPGSFPEAHDFGKQVSIALFGDVNAK